MREQLTFADEPVSGVVVPDLKDVQSFLYLQDVGGTESYQIYEIEKEILDSTTSRPLKNR